MARNGDIETAGSSAAYTVNQAALPAAGQADRTPAAPRFGQRLPKRLYVTAAGWDLVRALDEQKADDAQRASSRPGGPDQPARSPSPGHSCCTSQKHPQKAGAQLPPAPTPRGRFGRAPESHPARRRSRKPPSWGFSLRGCCGAHCPSPQHPHTFSCLYLRLNADQLSATGLVARACGPRRDPSTVTS